MRKATQLLMGVGVIALVEAGEARAQVAAPVEEAAAADEIVVTGTSIRGIASAGSPTIGLTQADIKQTGAATASEMTRLLPQVLNLGADESRSSFNGGAQDGAANSTAISGVNLRGLGPESTLLLLNGRRVAPNGVIKALFDINQLPANGIARIEVVTDGASAIYGADAVAGVVNLITRRKTDAIETNARYGFGDSIDQKVFGQTIGFGWGSGALFAAYEHNERSRLAGNQRGFASQDRRARRRQRCPLDARLSRQHPRRDDALRLARRERPSTSTARRSAARPLTASTRVMTQTCCRRRTRNPSSPTSIRT